MKTRQIFDVRGKFQYDDTQTYIKRISPQIRRRLTNETIKHGLSILKLNFRLNYKEINMSKVQYEPLLAIWLYRNRLWINHVRRVRTRNNGANIKSGLL